MNRVTITKTALILLMVLMTIITGGCAVDEWALVAEGTLTNIEEIKGRYAITFDDKRVVLLQRGYELETPTVVVLHQYYYLYKEDASAAWNGYHLVENER